jgi:hypothetical protein
VKRGPQKCFLKRPRIAREQQHEYRRLAGAIPFLEGGETSVPGQRSHIDDAARCDATPSQDLREHARIYA